MKQKNKEIISGWDDVDEEQCFYDSMKIFIPFTGLIILSLIWWHLS